MSEAHRHKPDEQHPQHFHHPGDDGSGHDHLSGDSTVKKPLPITNRDMERMIREFFEACMKPFVAKNAEYASIDRDSDEDSLSNFYEVAAEAGITPLQVWHVYFEKHRRVMLKLIRTGTTRIPTYKAIRDVIGYSYILYCLGIALGYWTHDEATRDSDTD